MPDFDELQAAAAELKRELAVRTHVYPGWVKQGKLREPVAVARLQAMETALAVVQEAIKEAAG